MPRPHEDLERHTVTDQRPGGPIVTLRPDTWWAIEVAHVAAERAGAGVATYETLIEKARASAPKAREAAVLRSHNDRRVIAMLHVDGHEAYRHLASAWDDHHLLAERHAVAESRSLALYRLAATAGEARVRVRAPPAERRTRTTCRHRARRSPGLSRRIDLRHRRRPRIGNRLSVHKHRSDRSISRNTRSATHPRPHRSDRRNVLPRAPGTHVRVRL